MNELQQLYNQLEHRAYWIAKRCSLINAKINAVYDTPEEQGVVEHYMEYQPLHVYMYQEGYHKITRDYAHEFMASMVRVLEGEIDNA